MIAKANMNEIGHLWIGGTTKKLYDGDIISIGDVKMKVELY